MAERTLIWDVFDYIICRRSRAKREKADRRRIGRIKPIRTYRNPIFLAREWVEAMEAGNFRSQQAFARAIGLSHARVSQMLGLLKLCPEVINDLDKLGDPLSSRIVTERKLRVIATLRPASQKRVFHARNLQEPS